MIWLFGKKRERITGDRPASSVSSRKVLQVGMVVRYQNMRSKIVNITRERYIRGRKGQTAYHVELLPWQGYGNATFHDQDLDRVEVLNER